MSQQSVHAEESTELPSSEPAKVTVEQPTAGDENSLAVKVHLHTPTTFTISYNDNNELYWKFEEKLRKLGLARDKVRLIYSETGQRLPIRNIYDMDLISSVGPTIQLYAPAPAENEIQKEGKRSRSPDGLHVAKFTLRQHSIPQFAVTYKNKDELYRGFIESLEKLQISPDTLYYIREDVDELAQVKDADELMAFARGQSFVSLYSRSEAEYEISFERMHTPAVPPPHMVRRRRLRSPPKFSPQHGASNYAHSHSCCDPWNCASASPLPRCSCHWSVCTACFLGVDLRLSGCCRDCGCGGLQRCPHGYFGEFNNPYDTF